ncbi:MAG: sigma-70 family RNA polymerase sigma factor [Chitinophagaceae bacterium]|nr:sigma-70 family RNA polymerase sigma factor [Chitinophagaceae bacterium]
MISPYFPLQSDTHGDERVFNHLIVTYAPYLFADIVAITRCRHSAADILQDTFLKLWTNRETITDENPGGWLYRVAVHAAYKHQKKESRKRKLLHEFNTGRDQDCLTAEHRLVGKEQRHQLKDIFTRLPQMQQKVFWLSREAGMSRDEIAHKLNISHNTVRVHLTRAQRFFKEQLNAVGVFALFFGVNIFCFGIGNTKSGLEAIYNTEIIYKMLPEDNKFSQHNRSASFYNIQCNEVIRTSSS